MLARRLLVEAREELTRADQKAQILLAGFGATAAVVFAGILAGSWNPTRLDKRIEWLWWTGVTASLWAMVALALAVRPKTSRDRNGVQGVRYFGDVVSCQNRAELDTALRSVAVSPFERDVDQLYLVSRIVASKYTWVRRGMFWAAAGGCSAVVAVLINLALANNA